MAPTNKTQMVSIPLEEYKELLLRDHPSDCEKVVVHKRKGKGVENMGATYVTTTLEQLADMMLYFEV